jgi:antitoxin component YwqK of YwqJK toxin-antitoxin module
MMAFLFVGCNREKHYSETQERGGVLYIVNEDKPYTGIVFNNHDNGNLRYEAPYKNGLKNGEVVSYYQNGQLRVKANYKNGQYDGSYQEYFDNGELAIDWIYKDGELVK